jgi:N-dimethylarginine dimethylaminohydrolase
VETGGAGSFGTAAYGGAGWSPREAAHAEEIGRLWARCGIADECSPLEAVLLRAPGPELAVAEADAAQYLEAPDPEAAAAEHAAMAEAYRAAGVRVLDVPDTLVPTPNRMFCADLFAMTPEGAILARPASTVRAGEEVQVAAALAAAGVPILATLTGRATFEGADLLWLDRETAFLGLGLRTNDAAARQIGEVLARIGARLVPCDMPAGTMHLMGLLRILDRDLALAWPRRTPLRAVEALRAAGYAVAFLPEAVAREAETAKGFNMVTLAPRRVLMPAGNPATRAWLEGMGVAVRETPTVELGKAAGAVGCLTGVVARRRD